MPEEEERWAVVPDFPDYAISSHGRVKNLRLDHILNPFTNSYGHQRVALYRDGQRFDRYVHRLVAEAFIERFHPTMRVVKREDQSNDLYNLKFTRDRSMGPLKRKVDLVGRIRRIRIVELDMYFRNIEDLARYIQGDVSAVYRVLRGERASHKGYTFEVTEIQP